ncbi:hypothetical protein LJC59_02005 [Desulfovibrio sp. OttesenSCG-928-A18]|nr:hypothetical protein [Desulfovibrio sp. OttesenSCG-928-A18]
MFTFQIATPDDADQIAQVLIDASEGIAERLFGGLVPGLNSAFLLSAALLRGEEPYLIDNIIRAKREDEIIGLLFSYPADEHKVPALLESFVSAKRLNPVRPLLESSIPGTLFINTFWCLPELMDTSFSEAIMVEALSRYRDLGLEGLSTFCWNDNEQRLRFFARHGFTIAEHLPPELVPLEGHCLGASIMHRKKGR